MKFPVPGLWVALTAPWSGALRIIGLAGLLAGTALLGACSAVKIAYNQGPELAYLRLDGYFDFNEAQTRRVKDELQQLQRWHRATQLPRYVDAINRWQALLPGEVNEAQVCDVADEVRRKVLAISQRAEPVVAELAPTLEKGQLAFLQRKFAKLNRDYQKDFLEGSPQQRLDKRLKKAVSRAEMLYGTLDEKQISLLRQQVAHSVFDAHLSLAEHQRRQQDALQTLTPLINGAGSAAQSRAAVRAYFERSVNSPNPAYRHYQHKLTRDNCRMLATLHNSTTPAQRAKAVAVLADYGRDFNVLAGQDS